MGKILVGTASWTDASLIEPGEAEPRKEGGRVKIAPMLYDTIVRRAEKRLLNLYSKVQEAPFLAEQKKELSTFLDDIPVIQPDLLEQKMANAT